MTARLPVLLDILDRADAQSLTSVALSPEQLLTDVQSLGTAHSTDHLRRAVQEHLTAQTPEANILPLTVPEAVAPHLTVASPRTWWARVMLAVGRWLMLRAQQGQPLAVLTPQEEASLDVKERQTLAALRDAAERHSPIISNTEENRWVAAFFQVRKSRLRLNPSPLTTHQKTQLGQIPMDLDPLVSPHFMSNAFSDRERTALADLLYDWLDHPELRSGSFIDEPLIRHVVAGGLNPDVPQGRVWLGLNHPRQTEWTIRQSCVYFHLDQALSWLGEAPAPPVPAKEHESLMWWATQAHFDIAYPTYWGFWATHEKQWAKRFQTTVTWILEHEKAALFHAKWLRKAIAQKHPQTEWIRSQMKQRGWPER